MNKEQLKKLLDESLVVNQPVGTKESRDVYRITKSGRTWDLSKIDFDKLKEEFARATYKNIEISDSRAFIQRKVEQMVQQNVSRTDFAQRLQAIIDAYNAGSSSADNYFDELVKFAKELKAESERHVREGLTEAELEIFDLLKKDSMTQEETQKDWYKDSQTKKKVQSAVEEVLHTHLPESYDRVLFKDKCHHIFEVIVDYASHGVKWAA